jgi:hypothetical protein
MAIFCNKAARAMARPILCPALVPRNIVPTPNTQRLVPTRDGYVLDAEGRPRYPHGLPTSHWVFLAERRNLSAFGEAVTLAPTRVRAARARFVYFPETAVGAGIVSNHLALVWREHGVEYAVTVHRAMPIPPAGQSWASPAQRIYIMRHSRQATAKLRVVAEAMKVVKPCRRAC